MRQKASMPKTRPFGVSHRQLKKVKWVAFWLVTGSVLAAHAQTPRQMEQGQIIKRGKTGVVAVQPQTPHPEQPSQTVKPESAAIAAVQAPTSRPLQPPQIAKPELVGMGGGQAQLPGRMQPAKVRPTLAYLAYDQTDNTFKMSLDLPADLRRVAVLPVAWEGSQADLSQGAETLQPELLAELIKTKKFEVVAVSPQSLRNETGQPSWTGAEILPADFFDNLQRVYGCDAVLFCELSTFRAYAPLAIGWRMKLVDARTGQILWAVDKAFDAEQPAVLKQARHYHFGGQWFSPDSSIDWKVENSPRQFGQYTINQALSTLPNRKEMTKVSTPATDVPSRRQSDKKLPTTKKSYGN